MDKIDTVIELAGIDAELRALLEASPDLAKGHEEDVEDIVDVVYLPRHPTKDEWELALRIGAGA